MRELQILVDRHRVGLLHEDNNLWVLTYDADWAGWEGGFDLSPALPRSQLQHRDGATVRPVQWYFDNLLPEEELRRIVANDAGLRDHDDAFALLEYLGAESAGSLTLVPPSAMAPADAALRHLPYPALSQRIRQLPRTALTRAAPKRMSLAGAQHKLLVVRKGDTLYEPVGATASTHILKPNHPDAQTYPASAFVEHLTMDLAQAAGLAVPAFGLLHVPEPVYVIERFDRHTDPQTLLPDTGAAPPRVRRLHVIDACQLLNRSRLFKHAGASVQALREAIERTGDTLTLPQRLFRWLVFNLLVGNDDCHLKNLSFIVQPGTITLAPHYDMLATAVFHTRALAADDGRWPHVELAVRLADDVRHFSAVTPESVLAAAAVLGVPQAVARRVVQDVVARTLRQFDRVYAAHFPDEPGLLMGAAGTPGTADPVAGEGADLAWASAASPESAIQRRILRVLRYVVLPEMRARLSH
jgi:serine/threonine-protein kinase HipA